MELKTAFLTASFLHGVDKSGSRRDQRLIRHLAWHQRFFPEIHTYISDNASEEAEVRRLRGWGTFLRHQDRLEKGPGQWDYPYCWRILYDIKILIQLGYEKIIFLDSDCFITSQRALDHIRALDTGWETFYCRKYGFPSAEAHVLCKDAFPIYEAFTSIPYEQHMGKVLEDVVPFTKVNHAFNVDRWGEDRIPCAPHMDIYSQAPVDLPLEFYP